MSPLASTCNTLLFGYGLVHAGNNFVAYNCSLCTYWAVPLTINQSLVSIIISTPTSTTPLTVWCKPIDQVTQNIFYTPLSLYWMDGGLSVGHCVVAICDCWPCAKFSSWLKQAPRLMITKLTEHPHFYTISPLPSQCRCMSPMDSKLHNQQTLFIYLFIAHNRTTDGKCK